MTLTGSASAGFGPPTSFSSMLYPNPTGVAAQASEALAAHEARQRNLAAAASDLNGSADPEHDAQSLRRVYGEMRSKYQRYRKETGKSSVPALREAVHAFKKGPSLTSLVGVATFLDERGLLPW